MNRLLTSIISALLSLALCFIACEPLDESPFDDTPSTGNTSTDKPSVDEPSTDNTDVGILNDAIYQQDGCKLGLVFYSDSGKKKVVSGSSEVMKWATTNSSWGISGEKTKYDYVHSTITTSNAYKENPDGFPAVKFCEKMRLDHGGNWHIPSLDEMEHLYATYKQNTAAFDATLKYIGGNGLLDGSASYWLCGQNSNGNMQYVNMDIWKNANAVQTSTKQVRCIRDVDENRSVSPVVYPKQDVAKVKTLLSTTGWTTTKIADGIIHYHFYGNEDVTSAKQNVNVLEVDLNNKKYRINFDYSRPEDFLSSISARSGAIAAVNATYEMSSVYLRANAHNYSMVPLDMSKDDEAMRYWKHGAAVVGNGARKIGIINAARGKEETKEGGDAAIELYNSLPEINIFSSGPILIDNYDTIGERFGSSPAASGIDGLMAEDYLLNTNKRHPRTIVALTEDNDILFIVIDGRSDNSAGMTAKEMTIFVKKYFNPQWALNMDGGGSSAMYIKGMGGSDNNIVNYPSDNGKWDHYGERDYRTVFLVQQIAEN